MLHDMRRLLTTMLLCFLSGCATVGSSLNAEGTAEAFWSNWQRSKSEAAYALFSKEQAGQMSFERFQKFIQDTQKQWGRFEDAQTVFLPFHDFIERSDLIPADVSKEQIKRYVYEVHFSDGSVNCDMTLIPQDGQYKIGWFAFWGTGPAPETGEKI